MTFSMAVQLLCVEMQARRLSPKTILFYKKRFRALEPTLGGMEIDRITPNDLRIALLACTTAHNSAQAWRVLRRLFRFLVAEDILKKTNPMVRVARVQYRSAVVVPLSVEEIIACFRAAGKNVRTGIRDQTILATLAGLGLRREEICTLLDENVMFDADAIKVVGKGNKERIIPIPTDLRPLLLRYKFTRDSTAQPAHKIKPRQPTPNFFRTHYGKPMTVNAVSMLMKQIGKKAGVRLHAHLLRHEVTPRNLDRLCAYFEALLFSPRGRRQVAEA